MPGHSLAPGAALSVGHARERAAELSATTAELVEVMHASGEQMGDGFEVGWQAAKAAATACVHAQVLVATYGGFLGERWCSGVRAVVLQLAAAGEGGAAERLTEQTRLLEQLSVALGQLEAALREEALVQLGSGAVVTDADLRRLLEG